MSNSDTIAQSSAVEEWRDIPRMISRHQVSTMGRVRSLDVHMRGDRIIPIIIRNPHITRRGYLRLRLDGKCYLVHRLVLFAFVGDVPPGHECAHRNGNRLDNRVTNLRWATSKDNALDRKIHGTQATGERVGGAKLTWEKVRAIRAIGRSRLLKEIAPEFGCSIMTVSSVIRGTTWRE